MLMVSCWTSKPLWKFPWASAPLLKTWLMTQLCYSKATNTSKPTTCCSNQGLGGTDYLIRLVDFDSVLLLMLVLSSSACLALNSFDDRLALCSHNGSFKAPVCTPLLQVLWRWGDLVIVACRQFKSCLLMTQYPIQMASSCPLCNKLLCTHTVYTLCSC